MRIVVQAGLEKKSETCHQNNQSKKKKRARGVAQVSKDEALSSNPRASKKR
jgi:hypothetical protein